jgi:putative peptidoglycan lipid II flippase
VLRKVREHVVVATVPAVSFSRAVAAMVVAGFAMSVVPLVEKLLALGLGPGSASHLEYATRVLIVPAVLFDGALAPQLLAGWSQRVVAEGRAPSRHEILAAAGRGVLLAGGLAALLAVFAPQLVGVLLRHGRFNEADAAAVSALLRVLAIGFVGSMGVLLTAQAYIAASRNRVLAVLTVLRGGVRVAVAVALLSSLRLLAFGVGFAVAEWCCFAALLVGCRPAPAAPFAARRVEA